MEFKQGWLARQIASAAAEVRSWSPMTRERMCCCNGHIWGESAMITLTQEIQTCRNCDRQRIKFTWADQPTDWVLVKRGCESQLVVSSKPYQIPSQ